MPSFVLLNQNTTLMQFIIEPNRGVKFTELGWLRIQESMGTSKLQYYLHQLTLIEMLPYMRTSQSM